MSDHDPKTDPNAAPPDATGAGAGPDTNGADDPAEVRRQRDDYLDQLQRARADFANFQKRSRAQADADRQYAVGSLARDLLDVLDNCERGAEAARKAGAAPSIAEGFDMVYRQLLGVLAKHGVEPIAALGEPFDPNFHEAILQKPDAEHPEGTVVQELGKGYRLRDRVLRPTKVAVSVRPGG